MVENEKIIQKLNKLLDEEEYKKDDFLVLFKLLISYNFNRIKVIDFKSFDEAKLQYARTEKIRCVQNSDFEWAADMRDLEKMCNDYIEYKKELNVDKSMFSIDNQELYYYYLGGTKSAFEVFRAIKTKENETISIKY